MTTTKTYTPIDLGDLCVHCGNSTAFGSGRFVNRIPAGVDADTVLDWCAVIDPDATVDGWACAECMARDCGRCPDQIPLDEDIYAPNGDNVHLDCLTLEEADYYSTIYDDEGYFDDSDGGDWDGFGEHIRCEHRDLFDQSSLASRESGYLHLSCVTCEYFVDVITRDA